MIILTLVLAVWTALASGQGCDLECWLGQLRIDLGAKEFPGGKIESFICTGLNLSALESSFEPPRTVGMNVQGLQIVCDLDVHVDVLGKYLLIARSEGSQLSAGAEFVQNKSTGLSYKANLKNCSATIAFKIKVPNHPIFQLVVDLVEGHYADRLNVLICTELTQVVEQDMTGLLQDINRAILPYLNGGGPRILHPNYGPNALNFTGNPFVGLADFLLDDLVGANGPFGVNLILSALTNNTGAFHFFFNETSAGLGKIPISSLGNVTFGISELNVTGLTSFNLVELLVPHDGYSLDSHAGMGDLEIVLDFFVNTTAGSGAVQDGAPLYETGRIRFSAANLSVGVEFAAGINARMAQSFTFDQLLSPGCLLDSIMGGNLTQARLNFALRELLVVAVSNGDQLEGSLDKLIDNLLLMFVTSYNPVIAPFVNAILLTPGIEAANEALVEDVFSQNLPCALAPKYQSSSYPLNQIAVISVLAAAGAAWIGLTAVICVLHYGRYKDGGYEMDSGAEYSDDPDEYVRSATKLLKVRGQGKGYGALGSSKEQAYQAGSFGLNTEIMLPGEEEGKKLVPIGLDPRLHWFFKGLIPLLLIGNIGLFVASNCSVGASVFVFIHLGDHTVASPSLFSFTLANSVHDMWVAGVYPLSLVIAIFSGTWPYVKLLAMLAVWLFPIRSKPRETVLNWLDMLGKWSLIDGFVLVFMMVAFRFNLVIPGSPLAHTADGASVIDLIVEADLGFYTFLLATMISLIITHLILAVHRWLEKKNEESVNDSLLVLDDMDEVAIAVFQRVHDLGDGGAVKASLFGTICVALLLIISFGMVVGGAMIDSFVFHFRGAAGALFPYAGVPMDRSFSLVSLAMELPAAALSPNGFGVRWVQAVFLLFAFVVPLAYLLMLLWLWLIPMKPWAQSQAFVLTEILRAWSAMEVFVLSVIVALTELEQFAQFLVGDRCDFINPFLEKFFTPLLDGNAKCFDVTTSLASGCWLMFGACVIYILAGQIVMVLVHEHMFPKLSAKETRSRLVRFLLWCKFAEEVR